MLTRERELKKHSDWGVQTNFLTLRQKWNAILEEINIYQHSYMNTIVNSWVTCSKTAGALFTV